MARTMTAEKFHSLLPNQEHFLQAIVTKHIPATDTKGARIKARDHVRARIEGIGTLEATVA